MTAPAQPTPPAQPAQPAQPPQPQRQGLPGVVRGFLILLAVVALLLAALWAFKAFRPAPAGPLGWDDETVASKLDAGRLRDCNLGEDFYASAGIHDVAKEDQTCSGFVTTAEGDEVRVELRTTKTQLPDPTATGDGELIGWKETKDPEKFESVDDQVFPQASNGMACFMASSSPMMSEAWLHAAGPCETLYPLARQLQNLQTQYDFSRTNHGLFDFSKPEFLEVEPASPDVTAKLFADAQGKAKAPGEQLLVDDDRFDNSTLTLKSTELQRDGDASARACAVMDFTLGTRNGYANRFQIPGPLYAIFPNGQTVEMRMTETGGYTLEEGETAAIEFCGDFEPEIRTERFLVHVAQVDGEDATWKQS